ncbi:Hypothetical Protein FCC1311_085702 [Hondaea fermentalgiana]|uniref:Uncharacterized protein n=1 Tax=Hondaea fermentalgiana TaxID=2315210 RepID=A0A2R5GNZ6_9STRA|nr:Hypothetical Protein FCC1311_085702 [Hondaea fermentalgiana]|eukprot:GBG32345.1 Hypothetical Protein FCC1311_085702 [Hondaea fermentalgiana]
MADAATILRRATTEEDLAQEVLFGGLRPSLHLQGERRSPAELEEEEDDDADEVFMQVKKLLTSAIESGQLKSLARAIALAWQAGQDSKLLRQAEPRMMRKAQEEVQLGQDLKLAMEKRNRIKLTNCLNAATELGLTAADFEPLKAALELECELEEEIRKSQDEARPGHTNKMQNVIGELHRKLIGHDLVKLQETVVREAASAEASMTDNSKRLSEALRRLDRCKAMITSSSKLTELQELQALIHDVSPQNQEATVKLLSEQVENLREDNTRLMMTLRSSSGGAVVYLSESSATDSTLNAEALVAEVNELRARAAKYGAEWMEGKKNSEIEEITTKLTEQAEAAKGMSEEEVERTVKRRVLEAQKEERKAKLAALEGLEKNLVSRHNEAMAQLQREYDALLADRNEAHARLEHFDQERYDLTLQLDAAHAKIRQLDKLLRMRG